MSENTVETTATPSASDAYLTRVAHVVAYEAARLGRESGSITASLVGVIITSKAWDVPKADKITLEAYVTAGGAEGTYRVARRMAGLLVEPKVSQEGHKTFITAIEAAHASETPTGEIEAVVAAYLAYKGKQGWQKFADLLGGKADVKAASAPKGLQLDIDKAIEAAMKDGSDASPELAEQAGQDASEAVEVAKLGDVSEVESKVLAYVRHCSLAQLDVVQAAITERVSSEAADVEQAA